MDWTTSDPVGAFKLFRQRMEMYLRLKKVDDALKIDYILLALGEEGLRIYNSWTALTEKDKKDSEKILNKFLDHLEPKSNFRLARFYLQRYRQQDSESIDDFSARCRLQAEKCEFRDAEEKEDRIIEQIISGIRHPEVQKELLAQDKAMTLDTAMTICRNYEASILHMKQLNTVQGASKSVDIHYLKQHGQDKRGRKQKQCPNCGDSHPRDSCPARNSICSFCQIKGHWRKVCQSRRRSHHSRQRREQSQSKRQHGKQQNKAVHAVTQDIAAVQTSPQLLAEQFESVSFDAIHIDTVECKDNRDEVLTRIDLRLEDRPTVKADLLVKLDTGAQGNVLPVRIFRRMFPNKLDPQGFPLPGATDRRRQVNLTAYNGTRIPYHGSLTLCCRSQHSDWNMCIFHVAESPGPAVLGLPSCRELRLVTLHCSVELDQQTPVVPSVSSVTDLKKSHPDQFDTIGNLKEPYHIVVNPEVPPIVHAPRKCPVQLKDEIKLELDHMESAGVIRKVQQPTPWVSSITFPRKSSGQLRVCLDPKDLNKAIMRTYHKTPTVEEITHKLNGATVFSKMDAKNGYWSIHLDEESQLLTTFNSPFGRYCFVRMPFGLSMSQDVFQYRMDMILEQCPGTIGIADDVAVFGKDAVEHDRNLLNLMEVAKKEGLVFNSEKCDIKVSQIKFFGMLYDSQGVHPDPAKVKAVRDLPSPTNVLELQQFLGLITYLSPFIPHLSQRSSNLRELLKANTEFAWSPSHQAPYPITPLLVYKGSIEY